MQETGSNNADVLTGLGLDEYFSRSDSSGTFDFLSDELGSTIGLTNSSGSKVVTNYSYEPFGFPTESGGANTNLYQFTGREYDPVVAAAGLYYMRGRYYSSRLQRFISMDPLRLSAGDVNFYRYVGNDPVDLTDPTGLAPGASGGGGAGPAPLPFPDPGFFNGFFGSFDGDITFSLDLDQSQLDEIFEELRALGFLTGVNLAGMGGGGTPGMGGGGTPGMGGGGGMPSGGVPSFVSASHDGSTGEPNNVRIPPPGFPLLVQELRKAPPEPTPLKVPAGECIALLNVFAPVIPVGCAVGIATCETIAGCAVGAGLCIMEYNIVGACRAQARGEAFPELPEPPR